MPFREVLRVFAGLLEKLSGFLYVGGWGCTQVWNKGAGVRNRESLKKSTEQQDQVHIDYNAKTPKLRHNCSNTEPAF